MRLVCKDCKTTMDTDKHLKTCPQCGSANVDNVLRNSSIDSEKTQLNSRNTMAKVKIIFWIMGITN